ncbi:MAG: L-threonylcarbamoyladenylate synthase [Nitrospinaceae bacterium]
MANVLPVDFEQPGPSSKAIENVQSVLNSGGVIAFPTDTFYGLGANPFNPDALSKIFQIKQRPADKPLLILIHSIDQLEDLTQEVTENARKLMEHFWPGPLTLIFKAALSLPDALTAGTGTIGIRLQDHPFTSKLLETLGRPLTAPSANISGMGELTTAQQVENSLVEKLELIVDGGPAPGGKPSTVLDTTTNPPTLLREGAVSGDKLESLLPIQIR